jgi:glycosyltransferase involved in cell wall biosynthesis
MRRQLGLSPGDFAFAVAGGFDFPRGKGQREFLAAAARIHKEVPQARFLIIGRGALAGILMADMARLGLGKKAWLTGQIAEMPLAMNAIDCLVHAQIGTEALGLVVCEAHACGKPVIASALDGIPEAFAPGGYGRLVAPENIEELAQAMKRQALEGKPDLTAAASLHARVAAFFSISRMAAGVLDLYAKVTRG